MRAYRASKTCLLAILVWGTFIIPDAHAQTVRGFVTAAADREPLQGVHVLLDDLANGAQAGAATGEDIHGAISNADGFYLISRVPPGRYQLRASYIGFETYVDTVAVAEGANTVGIQLSIDEAELGEVVIETEREGGAARVTAGQQTVRPEEIELIPSPDISGDLVSYLSTMPGVVLMGEQGGQVFIRGGEPTHNLTLLDGMYLFQPFHILGFYSAFPSEIVSRADVFAGGYGSQYSGRISSVIDVQTRNGDKRAFGGSAAVSPFTGSLHVEGPLLKDRISVLGSARVSLLDELASHYVDAPLPYIFSDLYGKMHAVVANDHRIAVSGLHTYDRGILGMEADLFAENDEIRWTNTAYGLRYLAAPSSLPFLGEILVSYSRLRSELGPEQEPERTSLSEMVSVAFNITNFAGETQVNWGGFLREPWVDAELGGLFQGLIVEQNRSANAGGYLEPNFYLGRGLHVRPGVSIHTYGARGVFVEPRFRATWSLGRHHWSAAAGLYRQEIVGLTDRRDATNIFTAWTEAPFGESSRAIHGLVGYRVTPAPWLELSAEVFGKKLDNLFIGEWTPFPRFTTRLQRAHGQSVGADFRVEVRGSRFYGFVNYGLSATRYEVDPENEFARDYEPYRPPHDRRHQINLLAATSLRGFDVSIRWQFGSGLPYTPIQGFDGFILMEGNVRVDRIRGFPRVIYEPEPYKAVLPTYHRLDISVERTFSIGSRLEATAHAGVLNLYDRRNLFSLDLFTGQRSDQLPVVPVIGVKIEV